MAYYGNFSFDEEDFIDEDHAECLVCGESCWADLSFGYDYGGYDQVHHDGECEKRCDCTGEELFPCYEHGLQLDCYGHRLMELLDKIVPIDGGYSEQDIALLSNRMGKTFEELMGTSVEVIAKDLLLYTVKQRMGLTNFELRVLGEAINAGDYEVLRARV